MITTVQCSICSQLNNKPRVVVTDFRLHHTCSIIIITMIILMIYTNESTIQFFDKLKNVWYNVTIIIIIIKHYYTFIT